MYKRYSRVKFFNSKGQPLNFSYDTEKEIWTGTIHLPKVSVNLIENQTIYMVEEFQDAASPGPFNVIYGKPHIDQVAISPNITGYLENIGSTGYKLFTVDNPYNNNPVISLLDTLDIELIQEPTDVYDSTTERLITSNNVNEVIKFDIMLKTPDEGVHEKRLIIKDDVDTIAIIDLYSEVEGEDERLNSLLARMGEVINEKEEYIFRESDINEGLPNYRVLNAKRKELLVELHNIKPYFAAYKGIVNIIKFFGYYDLQLKEYWLNTDTDKFVFQDVRINDITQLDEPNQYLNAPYKKTAYFGLFYQLNRIIEDEFDEFGIPQVEFDQAYSNEEIIIKLFGLKKYISDRNIGGLGQIIDIIGEITHFKRYEFNVWTDKSVIQDVDTQIVPKFSADNNEGYIQDVRNLLVDYTTCPLAPEVFDDPTTSATVQFGNYPTCFVGHFSPSELEEINLLDEPNIPIGFPVNLTNNSFDSPWSACTFSWASTGSSSILVTWATITNLNFYEVEWIIKKVTQLGDPHPYEYRTRDTVANLATISLILPYEGEYDVTLILYGYDNQISKHTEKSFIKVYLREADFISFHRYRDNNLQSWMFNYLTWEDIESEWNAVISDNNNFIIDQNDIQNRTFSMVNFIPTDQFNNKFIGIKPPTWEKFLDENVTWNDYMFITWDQLIYPLEKLAHFFVTAIQSGGTLQIGEDEFTVPIGTNIHEFQIVADTLEAETGDDIEGFDFTARTVDQAFVASFIDCVATLQGKEGDRYIGASGGVEITEDSPEYQYWNTNNEMWENFPLTWNNSQSATRTRAVENPFSFDDSRIFNDRFDIPKMVPIFFCVDNSKMAGKTKAIWTVTDNDTGEVLFNGEYLYMVVRFPLAGYYDIEVEIEDTNGNKQSKKKEKHIRVWDPVDYSNKLLLENFYQAQYAL